MASSEINNRIHFADGNKGGVGKSFFARTLYQWFLDKQIQALGMEADVNSPDFHGIYPDVMLTQFSENEELSERPNKIINLAVKTKRSIVVNMPATVHQAFKAWCDDYDIVELAADNQIELVKWFVVTGEYDSARSLEASLKTFGGTIPHIVVRNRKYSDWEFFDGFEDLHDLIQESKGLIIDLPKLPVRTASTLLQQRLTFDAGRSHTSDRYGIAEQASVKRYLKKAYAAMESTGYLPC